ncbi:hypothetical protein BJ322DRAFT_1110367 [Thelephora terrestris]|uniref:Uncharacterized protein n=1 Tax=Thelephora terrestris TaxID=56493 RepID=A0A9P6HDQ1_9AGAM|nr:hypothetical protein BJ322DRAFT_1110367 [Thelephora terrestris]
MAASNPYPPPVESDGDESGGEVQHCYFTRLAVKDSAQGSDGGLLADYVDTAPKESPGPGDA